MCNNKGEERIKDGYSCKTNYENHDFHNYLHGCLIFNHVLDLFHSRFHLYRDIYYDSYRETSNIQMSAMLDENGRSVILYFNTFVSRSNTRLQDFTELNGTYEILRDIKEVIRFHETV